MTEYDGSGLERAKVCVRLLALGYFYWDWCAVTFGETTDIRSDLSSAADRLEIHPFYLGQLAGASYGTPEVEAHTPDLSQVLVDLASDARRDVVRVLTEAHGDPSVLFVALWRSSTSGQADDEATDWDILNRDVSAHKSNGYDWIAHGCPVHHTQ